MRAVGQQGLTGQSPGRDAHQAGGPCRDEDLQLEHGDDLAWRETDGLHDPDLPVGRDHDPGYQVRHDRRRRRQGEDAERDQHAGDDLVGDVEDVSNEDVVDGADDASRRKRGSESIHVRLQLGARRIGRESIGHEVVGRVLGAQAGYRRARHPGMLAAQVRASFVNVDDFGRDSEHWFLRNAGDLDLLADPDVVQLGERSRERDLIVAARQVTCGDADLFHGTAWVVTTDRVQAEFAAAGLELQRGDRIWATRGRRAQKLRRGRYRLGVRPAVVRDLQVS